MFGILIKLSQTPSVGHAKLQRVLEAQLDRQRTLQAGSLLHHPTDEIVGKQIDPDLLERHGGTLAAEYFQTHGGFQVAKVQFDMPSLLIKRFEFALRRQLGGQECSHQRLSADLKLANEQPIRCPCKLRFRHP